MTETRSASPIENENLGAVVCLFQQESGNQEKGRQIKESFLLHGSRNLAFRAFGGCRSTGGAGCWNRGTWAWFRHQHGHHLIAALLVAAFSRAAFEQNPSNVASVFTSSDATVALPFIAAS